MHLFHLTEAPRWRAAQAAGAYAWSTRGRSLAEEGFIHTAREDQWADVRRRHYAGVDEPLVLLVIDSARLTAPWSEEPAADETFPHIHGPLNLDAVITAVPLGTPEPDAGRAATTPTDAGGPDRDGGTDRPTPEKALAEFFLAEVMFRAALGLLVMGVAVACSVIGGQLAGDTGALVGILLGGAAAFVLAWRIARWRDRRTS